MTWVDAPSSKTLFEQFLFEQFGIYKSLSIIEQSALAIAVLIICPVLVRMFHKASVR